MMREVLLCGVVLLWGCNARTTKSAQPVREPKPPVVGAAPSVDKEPAPPDPVPVEAPERATAEVVFQLPPAVEGEERWIGAIYAVADDRIVAAGASTIVEFDGRDWHLSNQPGARIFRLRGRGPTDLYAVGTELLVMRNDGHAWRRESFDETGGRRKNYLYDIVFQGDSVFAVGPSRVLRRGQRGVWADADAASARSVRLAIGAEVPRRVPCRGTPRRAESGELALLCNDARLFVLGPSSQWHLAAKLNRKPDDVLALLVVGSERVVASFTSGHVSLYDGRAWEDVLLPNDSRGLALTSTKDSVWVAAEDSVVRIRLRATARAR